jgi:hypothetical protein
MALAPGLRRAYERAHYVVFAEPGLAIRVGEPNAALDRLLAKHRARTAAYVTAANPRGRRRGALRNRIAFAALMKRLRRQGRRFLPGEGRDPQGRWPAEASFLVLGLSRAQAEALGGELAQNAIVWIEQGRAPRLVTPG